MLTMPLLSRAFIDGHSQLTKLCLMGAEFRTHGNVARSHDAATVLIDSDKRSLLKFRLSKMYLKLTNSVEGLLHQPRNSREGRGRGGGKKHQKSACSDFVVDLK